MNDLDRYGVVKCQMVMIFSNVLNFRSLYLNLIIFSFESFGIKVTFVKRRWHMLMSCGMVNLRPSQHH